MTEKIKSKDGSQEIPGWQNAITIARIKVEEYEVFISPNTLSTQIENIIKDSAFVKLFEQKDKDLIHTHLMNGDNDAIKKMLNDCLIQINKYNTDDKDILKEWYKALVEDGSLSHQMTTLEQINILLRDTGLLKDFLNKTTNTSISTKTLFRKLGLSPHILTNTTLIKEEEYQGYSNITIGLQYFLSWLYDDKLTFGKLETQQPYVIPSISSSNKIEFKKNVNTHFGRFAKTIKNSEIFSPHGSTGVGTRDEVEDRTSSINYEDAYKYLKEYRLYNTVFSDTGYKIRKLNHLDHTILPDRLHTIMKPIIEKAKGKILIGSVPYYEAIRTKNTNEQIRIEEYQENKLLEQMNDFKNVRGLAIYSHIITHKGLKSASISNYFSDDPYKEIIDLVYNATNTATKYYLGCIDILPLDEFRDRIQTRRSEVKNTDGGIKAQQELEKKGLHW